MDLALGEGKGRASMPHAEKLGAKTKLWGGLAHLLLGHPVSPKASNPEEQGRVERVHLDPSDQEEFQL